MINDSKRDFEIYDYFSECLRIFRKKMQLLYLFSTTTTEEGNQTLLRNLRENQNEAKLLIEKFDPLLNTNKIHLVFNRFILRVKQIAQTYSSKNSLYILSYIERIEQVIKGNQSKDEFHSLLNKLILQVPDLINSNCGNFHSKQISMQRKVAVQQLIVDQKQVSLDSLKQKSLFDKYQKYIETFQKYFELVNCLEVEQYSFRKVFFQAIEDRDKKQQRLYEDMIMRNRFIKEIGLLYQRQFNIYQKKLQERRIKLNNQRQFLEKERINTNILQLLEDKSPEGSPIIKRKRGYKLRRQETHKTSYQEQDKKKSDNKRLKSIQSLHLEETELFPKEIDNRLKRNKNILTFYDTYTSKFNSGRSIMESGKDKNKNLCFITLKKVQFKGSKLELAPQLIKKNEPNETEEKEIVNRRVTKSRTTNRGYQQVRKRGTLKTEGQQSKSINQEQKKQYLKSIKINFCRYVI